MDHEPMPNRSREFAVLARDVAPGAALETRTVAALHAAGLLRRARGTRRAWLVAAAIVLYAGGVATGRMWPMSAASVADPRPRFLLLLHGSEGRGADEAAVVAAYRAWAGSLAQQGRSVSGERLAESAVAVPSALVSAADGERLQGYFVISAASLDDAVDVARSCPHVARGGRVIVRPIDALP
jgi:hypothetical protein